MDEQLILEDELQKDWETSIEYWDRSHAVSEEILAQIRWDIVADEFELLSPSYKQRDALRWLSKSPTPTKLLDFGCGFGWGSIILACYGVKNIIAVDAAPNMVTYAQAFVDGYKVDKNIHLLAVNKDWLSTQEDESYDGFFTSNVLDTIPDPMCEYVLKHVHRILKKGSKAVVSLNFYTSVEDEMKASREIPAERNKEIKEKKYVYINEVLRMVNHNDEYWTKLLSKYFKVVKLEHYGWEGEQERRRLFTLIKE